jgi:hypothetical protein
MAIMPLPAVPWKEPFAGEKPQGPGSAPFGAAMDSPVNDSHSGIANIAATLIVLLLIVAATAAVLLGRRTDGAVAVPDPAT